MLLWRARLAAYGGIAGAPSAVTNTCETGPNVPCLPVSYHSAVSMLSPGNELQESNEKAFNVKPEKAVRLRLWWCVFLPRPVTMSMIWSKSNHGD